MKIVIDIDDKSREKLFDIANNGLDVPIGLLDIMIMSIVNGTPLPKGHGRLIDADAYVKEYGCCGYLEDIDIDCFNMFVPTIIEADK